MDLSNRSISSLAASGSGVTLAAMRRLLLTLIALPALLVVGTSACTRSRDTTREADSPSESAEDPKRQSKRKAASCDDCKPGSCTPESAASCHALAEKHGRGRGVPFDLAKKAHYEKLACDHGHGAACRELAWLHHDGAGVKHADGLAAELNEKACNLGDGDGCIALGRMHEQGIIGVANEESAQRWFDRGRELFARACEAGDLDKCERQGQLYLDGVGVTVDAAHAYTLFEKGCPKVGTRSEASCVGQALLFIAGRGTTQDKAKGETMLADACKRKVSRACAMLGQELWLGRDLKEDPVRALGLLVIACDDNDAIACGALGAMLEGVPGVPRDVAASLTRRDRACALRNSLACREAANMLMQGSDEVAIRRAREFLEHGCHIGDGVQCGLAAMLHRHGRGGPPDETTANILWAIACQRRALLACVDLIRRNEPLPLNPEDTKKVREEACRRGFTAACTQTL